MADVFEPRAELDPWRDRLWELIEATPFLDWLLLTKGPEQVAGLTPWSTRWPDNVWLGTTVENQHWADRRIPILAKFPAAVRFLSCEPLLGPLDLHPWLGRVVHWVIAGGKAARRLARPTRGGFVIFAISALRRKYHYILNNGEIGHRKMLIISMDRIGDSVSETAR
jgi:protein gp37